MLLRTTLLAVITVLPVTLVAQAADPHLELARRVLRTTPLFDGHNDLPWAIRQSPTARGNVAAYDLRTRTEGHTDLERLRQGMVGAQWWSVYLPGDWADSGYARVQL
ncbi:MAG TPA: membrane dipeptidase, partial [Gemmatimonadales bacterium]|nr:membrane dipeptidase [Gemmatimonadales bacterium]